MARFSRTFENAPANAPQPRLKPSAAMRGSLEQAANGNGLNRTRKFGTMALSAAARALRRNKTRAALTMLGIFIGVAAVIAMVAVGDGARYSVQQQIQSLGTNLLVVLPGATTANGVRAGAGSISTLTVADGEAIQKEVLVAAAVSYADHQVAQVVYAHQNWSTSIAGTTPIYLTIRDWPVVDGRNFTDEEERSAAPVCLLGRTVVNNLFGPGEDPVGTDRPGEEFSPARDRCPRRQGPVQLRHRSGRRGTPSLQHRGAKGTGYLASNGERSRKLHRIEQSCSQPVHRCAKHHRHQSDLCSKYHDDQPIRWFVKDLRRGESDLHQGARCPGSRFGANTGPAIVASASSHRSSVRTTTSPSAA